MKLYYVYILKCSDNSYYTGITNDVERRFLEHQSGINPKSYTYSRRPLSLVFIDSFTNPNDAIEAEKKIKGWSRKKKEAIIRNKWEELRKLARCKNGSSHIFNYKVIHE